MLPCSRQPLLRINKDTPTPTGSLSCFYTWRVLHHKAQPRAWVWVIPWNKSNFLIHYTQVCDEMKTRVNPGPPHRCSSIVHYGGGGGPVIRETTQLHIWSNSPSAIKNDGHTRLALAMINEILIYQWRGLGTGNMVLPLHCKLPTG